MRGLDWRITAATGLLLFAGAAGGQSRVDRTDMDRLRAEARRLGFPLTPEELAPKRPVPPEKNAALVYAQIQAKFKDFPETYNAYDRDGSLASALSRQLRGAASDTDREKIGAFLGKIDEALQLAERASKMPECWFNWDYSKGIEMTMPELGTLRRLGRVFVAKAHYQADSSQYRQAIETLAIAFRVNHQIGSLPVITGSFMALTGELDLMRQLRYVLQNCDRDPLTLKRAKELVDELAPIPDLRAGLYGDLVTATVALQNMKAWQDIGKAAAEASLSSTKTFETGPALKIPEAAQIEMQTMALQAWIDILNDIPPGSGVMGSDEPRDREGSGPRERDSGQEGPKERDRGHASPEHFSHREILRAVSGG